MGLGDRVHNHKAKINKDTNYDTFRPMQNLGTPAYHKSTASNFDVTKKCYEKTYNQGKIYSDKQT